VFTFLNCYLLGYCFSDKYKSTVYSFSLLYFLKRRISFLFAKGLGNSRSNKFFEGLPSHMNNRNVAGGPSQSAGNRRGVSLHRRSSSGRRSRGSATDQADGQVIDVEDENHSVIDSVDRGESYKAMVAPMATKRSVR
jgi:hypothetical protein